MKHKKIISLLICMCILTPCGASVCTASAENTNTVRQSAEPSAQPLAEDADASDLSETGADTNAAEALTEEEYFQQTIDQYSDFDYSDPQSRIAQTSTNSSAREKAVTDEKLFGVWDQEAEAWTTEPCIDYAAEEYQGLSLGAVEDCVKNGDYDGAKEELLAYYRQAYARHDRSDVAKLTEQRQLLTAQTAFDNLIRSTGDQAYAVEKFTLTPEEQTFSADVLDDVKDSQSSVNKTLAYLLVALKKDGYTGVFNSREAAQGTPYIQLTVNGTVRIIEAEADNTLRAGSSYKNTSDGSGETLKAEESYSTIGKSEPVDDYTQRGYIRFDLSGIDEGDSISDARLYITGHMEKSANPSDPGIEKQTKDVILWKSSVVSWDENNFTWANCTDHEIFSYDGERGANFSYGGGGSSSTKVIPSLQDNTSKFSSYIYNTARAYKGTGEEAYAYHTVRLLLHSIATFAERFPDDPTCISDYTYSKNSYYHNAGQRAKFLGEILSCVINSDYMTPDAFTAIMKHAFLLCNGLVNGWGTSQEGNNIGSLQIEGLFKLCTIMREFKNFSKPLENGGKPAVSNSPGSVRGGWFEVVKYRMGYKVKQDLFSDGSSIEVGLGYADLNLSTFLNNMEAAVNVGMPAEGLLDEEGMEALNRYALYLLNASNPQFGDWQHGHAYSWNQTNYMGGDRASKYIKFITDPRVLWAATGGEQGEAPDYYSVAYNVGMKAILRCAWDKNSVAMQINADGGRESHGQSDDLGLNLYAYGEYLLVDSLYHNYTATHPMNVYLNSTRAHNTVEINDTSQKAITTSVQSIGNPDPDGNIINTPGGSSMGSLHEENQELNDAYDFIRAETVNYTDNNYDGPIELRNSDYTEKEKIDFKEYRDVLFIKPDFAIVSDYIEPSRDDLENKYSQNWHLMPGTEPTLDTENNIIKTNTDSANLHIVAVNSDREIDEAQKRQGYYAVSAGTEISNPFFSFIKHKKGTVTFNTVLYPTRPGEDKTVTVDYIPTGVDDTVAVAFNINVTDNKSGDTSISHYYAVMGDNEAEDRSFGSYSTDGTNAYIAPSSSGYENVILRNGTYIKDGDKYILGSDNELKDINIGWTGRQINLYSADITNEESADGMFFYAPKGNEKVYLNDNEISTGRKGDYLYIGSASEDIPAATSKPTEKPSAGGGGSTGGSSSHGSGGVNGGISNPPVTAVTPSPDPTPVPEKDNAFDEELQGHWAEQEIRSMIDRGIIDGDDAGRLNLKSDITRAEFVTMAVRAAGYDIPEYNGEFNDVAEDDWYAGYIAAAFKNGIIEGDGSGNAEPQKKLTREEMAKIMVSLYEQLGGHAEAAGNADYSDAEDISSWALPYVAAAEELGLMNGMDDGRFMPKQNALREQAIVVLYRMLKTLDK